jgi:hypothetical protein
MAQFSGAYSHVSQKRRDPSTSLRAGSFDFPLGFARGFGRTGQAMGHPLPISDKRKPSDHAAGGRIVITRMSVSLIWTGPASPEEYQRKLLHCHCSGDARSVGFWVAQSFQRWPSAAAVPSVSSRKSARRAVLTLEKSHRRAAQWLKPTTGTGPSIAALEALRHPKAKYVRALPNLVHEQ